MSNAEVLYEEIDLDDTKAASGLGSREPLLPGVYTARFSALEVSFTKNGNPQVVGQWTINDGPYEGQTVRDWIVFSVKSGPFIKLRVQALGLPIPPRGTTVELAEWFGTKADGRLAIITVTNREREDGKVFAEVVNIASARSQTGARTEQSTVVDDEAADNELPF